MINLDNPEEIKKLDPKDVLESTDLFLEQCKQIHSQIEDFSFPNNYQPIYNIVLTGMGGSALGAQVVYHLFKDQLKEPLHINNDYDLPAFVDTQTLVILSSYSGTTEEVFSCFEEAKKKGAKIVGLTTGGKLAPVLEQAGYPVIVIDPKNNPSGQPRLGTGYAVFGVIDILRKLNLLEVDQNQINKALEYLAQSQESLKQAAKEMAPKILNYIPVIFAASHLVGSAHVLRNQFNETSKSFSTYSPLPELNHHLMEGLKNPSEKKLMILMLSSDLYPEKLKIRVEVTKDVVKQNNIPLLEYKPSSSDKLAQCLEVLMFGGYLTFYLAMLYNQDPSLIPWVDYFKEQLASHSSTNN